MPKWILPLIALLVVGCSLPSFGSSKLPVKESQVWGRAVLGPGDEAKSQGIFFRDVKSGQTEAWQHSLDGPAAIQLTASIPVDGLALLSNQNTGWLINRASRRAYEWDLKAMRVLAASPTRLLLQMGETEQYQVTDWNFKSVVSFKAPQGKSLGVIAPDGKTAAVVTSPSLFHLVNLQDRSVTLVADQPRGDNLNNEVLFTIRDGAEIGFGYIGTSGRMVRRYSWDGKLLGEIAVPGVGCDFTRDGSRMACPGGTNPVRTAVFDVATGEPLYRVLGAENPMWTADGALAVSLPNYGGSRIVTADGKVAATGATKLVTPVDPLVPAPDTPNLFGLRGRIVDATGKVQFQATLGSQDWHFGWIDPWGKGGAEFIYLIRVIKPMGLEDPPGLALEPKVQKAPFPAEVRLQVVAPAGDCLNLRAEAGTAAKIVRCLPGGTALSVQPAEPVVRDNNYWVSVKTADEISGWVSASTGNLTYAN